MELKIKKAQASKYWGKAIIKSDASKYPCVYCDKLIPYSHTAYVLYGDDKEWKFPHNAAWACTKRCLIAYWFKVISGHEYD